MYLATIYTVGVPTLHALGIYTRTYPVVPELCKVRNRVSLLLPSTPCEGSKAKRVLRSYEEVRPISMW